MKITFRNIKPGDIIYIIERDTGKLTESKISSVYKFNNYFGHSERRVFLENGDMFEAPTMTIANQQNGKIYYVSEKLAKNSRKF